MKKKQQSSLKSLWVLALALLIAVAAVLVIMITDGASRTSKAESDLSAQTAEGTAYIERMESVSTAKIEEKILAEEQEKIDEDQLAEMLSDPSQIFSAIQENNVVLVGESRTSGFSAYGFMDENTF